MEVLVSVIGKGRGCADPMKNDPNSNADIQVGAPITYVSDDNIKKKWIEIISHFVSDRVLRNKKGNLYRKDKNGNLIHTAREYWYSYLVPGVFSQSQWNDLIDNWSASLENDWRDAIREKKEVMLFDSTIHESSAIRTALGKDVRGDVDLVDTWVWSDAEKTQFYPMQVTGFLNGALKGLTKGRMYNMHGIKVHRIDIVVDFNSIIDLSPESKAEILNYETLVEPRRNKSITPSKFKDLASLEPYPEWDN